MLPVHPEAYAGFRDMLKIATDIHKFDPNGEWVGLDVGGRNVNGSVRAELPNTKWHGLDIRPGPDVDFVGDASAWVSEYKYDVVIATELFEHAERWREIIQTMYESLDPNGPGIFISTCASTGRPPHGASGEWGVPIGEWYGNVAPGDLQDELQRYFEVVHVRYQQNPGDAYAVAWRVIP